jgi:hypothetical protein
MVGSSPKKPKPEIVNKKNQEEYLIRYFTVEIEKCKTKNKYRNGVV